MSTKKKTANKLVASIRKSKTGTVANKTSQRPDATETAAESKSVATRSAPKPAPKEATIEDRRKFFSHGRRVWPD